MDTSESLAPTGRAAQYFGLYRGAVSDNEDPEKRGRLRVRVPAVLGSAEVWADPCAPYAGPSLGLYLMPEPDTPVWVAFEAGDPSYPVWLGFAWKDGDIASADATASVKFLRTKKFTLRIDDIEGEIVIENDSGSTITLNAQSITVKSQSVVQEASGGRKTNLSASSFSVNDGSMEVT
jgi:uncharacterized protein involved in type VI secretion and phage assembly